ncbi:hypothetical protein GF325_12215, partial [Candidatus Bathyarchaeota archaeon]|nr:hypothetical protein [Candidatus Bathyarchaeota archaeon]
MAGKNTGRGIRRLIKRAKAITGKKKKKDDLWNQVGFHRVAGAYLYGYVLALGEAVLGIVIIGTIIPLFLPYPEINGYKGMTASILGFWFGLMDLNLGGGGGFSDGMTRFIGQYADSDPKRAIKYIQFYIWFQMFTGLLQVTIIIFFTMFYLVNTSLGYLAWFIIGQSLVQYPGCLMVMTSSMKAFQRGDKLAWLVWLQNTVFQVSVNVVCMIIGRWWGARNPRIGELMGITLFYILSQFLDDWINLFLGGYMFGQVLKSKGIATGIWAMVKPDFDHAIIKEVMVYTGKQWIGTQVLGLFDYMMGVYIIIIMPSMASWTGLLLIPEFLGHLVSHQSAMTGLVAPALSESYNNGKKQLTKYFLNNTLKWYSIVTFYMFTSLVLLSPRIIHVVVDAFPELQNYEAGLVMIPVVLLIDMTGPVRGFWTRIFNACDKPLPPIILRIIFTVPGYLFQFLFIYLCVTREILPIWLLLMVPGFINSAIQTVVGFTWIHLRVIKFDLKRLAWQGLIAPVLACLAFAGVLLAFMHTLWPLLEMALGLFMSTSTAKLVIAAIVLLSMFFIFPGTFFCPFLALFGGWDDYTLEEL